MRSTQHAAGASPAHHPPRTAVHRIEVFAAPGHADPIGQSVRREAAALGVPLANCRATHVYLLEGPLTVAQIERIRVGLLTDPVTERSLVGAAAQPPGSQVVEVHPHPGVMDPVAQSVERAIMELLGLAGAEGAAAMPVRVATGWRYDLTPAPPESARGNGTAIPQPPLTPARAAGLAERLLANPVIQRVHTAPFHPDRFPTGASHDHAQRTIPLRGLDDDALARLSRDAHLFLSTDEMAAIREHYSGLGREPAEIELETLAQTWSEHCVHKTLKSTIRYTPLDPGAPDPIDWSGRPGHERQADGTIVIRNLLKSTVAAATHSLIKDGVDWTLSVFVDNAGVIAFDEAHAVNVKVETHNHPSAIEPYGGAATGIGGCIRDVIATGLGARPIASTDVFCVAFPDQWNEAPARAPASDGCFDLPPGTLHPRRTLTQVVAGVRDYGNRMGIPTVAGAVAFDNRYVGNPLVFCGCIGVLPRDKVHGRVNSGDLIVALGGRTGRDGIHGATFSSAELEHTSADEFAHAVQIGNAITQKQTLDAIMRARDEHAAGPLYSAMTDCGAGGFSSAIGELGKSTGATVHLDRAPLKYPGLSATEVWISEAQERFVLAVPPVRLEALRTICREEGVELAVLGEFAPPEGSTAADPDLRLIHHGRDVGRLSMRFMHDGLPTPRRDAAWGASAGATAARPFARPRRQRPPRLTEQLAALLSHPAIASKHWIIRQYDHEVRGNTAVKPLVGPAMRGPSDAGVICPVAGSMRGLAIACGLCTPLGDPALLGGGAGDPYLMALAAIDECVRNLICVGADPARIAILDNFCWPSCKRPENLGALVRAAEGCYDAALAYRTPFVSGKDSLNNQLNVANPDGSTTTIEIPPTLLISGIGIVPDVRRCVTSDAKRPGNAVLLIGPTVAPAERPLRGSVHGEIFGPGGEAPNGTNSLPRVDLAHGPRTARAVAGLIARGAVRSAHDCSEGGALTALAEMLIAGSTPDRPIGAAIDLAAIHPDAVVAAFAETPSRYLLEVALSDLYSVQRELGGIDVPHIVVARLDDSGTLAVNSGDDRARVADLTAAWLAPLDW